ncbi:unnamed protein product [Pieris macdunnoughi]|uniref:Retrotransposon gag domain-containing protein n=1 Tax=Pieris macdunnoughi TaxID=345717 RepID=A0A821UH82_9NEOP|nr:unnamed protein product [Pieris macdunnoughi]
MLRNQMNQDIIDPRNIPDVECLTLDLEKRLPLPRIPTNVAFYKRQLWLYNSGIHSASDDVGHCYVWVEGEPGRGAQEATDQITLPVRFNKFINKNNPLVEKTSVLDSFNIPSSPYERKETTYANSEVGCDKTSLSEFLKTKYDGKSCVRAFIIRLEELKLARNIPDERMLRLAPEIFTGEALHGLRSVRDRIGSWHELLSLLRTDFDTFDFDYKMMNQIRSRSQGEEESITIYLAIIHGMFSRLFTTARSEADKLEIILLNIRPCYAGVLATNPNNASISELREVCRNYERINARYSDSFV